MSTDRSFTTTLDAPAYKEQVLSVEPYGVEQIRTSERHGRPRQQFTLWLGSNLTIADFALGFLPVKLGLPWSWTTLSILVGNLLGSFALAACAAMGPAYGRPQMRITYFTFGRLGGRLPAILNYISTIGWFTTNNILGAFGLRVLFPGLAFWQGAMILVVIQGLLAIYGHNLIHMYERMMSVVLGVMFLMVTIVALFHGQALAAYHPVTTGLWPEFAIMTAAVFSYIASWGPYASDYSRYLPAEVSRGKIVGWAFLGSFIAAVWLELVGVAVAILAGPNRPDPIASLYQVTGGFGSFAVISIILGGTAADALNLYSNALSAASLGIRLPRWLMAVGASVIGLMLSLVGSGSFEHNYENFLLMLGYWMTPWAGVLFADFYVLRRWRVAGTDRRDEQSMNSAGMLSFLIGIAASIWFMDGPLYEGPVAKAMGGADLSFYVGFLAALLVYLLLGRRETLARPSHKPHNPVDRCTHTGHEQP
ncbi:MAG: cytosine permease [Alicyclobacillus sp.]|nr:cytosine permease [Alicyclobacillus sp.]